jgi:hypothetical protein
MIVDRLATPPRPKVQLFCHFRSDGSAVFSHSGSATLGSRVNKKVPSRLLVRYFVPFRRILGGSNKFDLRSTAMCSVVHKQANERHIPDGIRCKPRVGKLLFKNGIITCQFVDQSIGISK